MANAAGGKAADLHEVGAIKTLAVIEDLAAHVSFPRRTVPRPADVAAYIADLAEELAAMARGSRLSVLAHILDLAQLEAGSQSERRTRAKSR